MMSSKYVFLFLYFVVGLASTSCQSEKRNSVLVLAFDRLPTDSVTCNDDRSLDTSGFAKLCKESIRFTHSYTTSLQPAAAMASLLTGEYPFQHQLHRSFDRISENSVLASRLAQQNDLRTSFFSGSPHILKKTGLSNYFSTFDDSSSVVEKNYFRDFKLQTTHFFDWYKEDPKPFFSVIYNSELEFLRKEDGNSVEKLDEKLSQFIDQLKEEKIWESTTLFLVGLNGINKYQRISETPFQNLHSENTQIVTMLKLPRSKGDEGISWKNDTPIQLADVGLLLKNILTKNLLQGYSDNMQFQIYDLTTLLNSKNNTLLAPREILIEAANTWSKNQPQPQFAVLANNDLYIDSRPPAVYNTLTDLLETTNLYAQKKQTLAPIELKLSRLKQHLNIGTKPEVSKLKTAPTTDRLQALNLIFENIWGISFQ
jgi:hypothetical protein